VRVITTVIVSVFLSAPAAWAGVDLAWDLCPGTGGVSNVTFDCSNPDEYRVLYGVLTSPVAVDSVWQGEAHIDLWTDAVALPDFWHLYDPVPVSSGSCNAIGVNEEGHCVGIPRAFVHTPGSWYVGAFMYVQYLAPDRARLRLALESGRHQTLAPGAPYGAFELYFPMWNASAAGGPCDGCETPVAMVWTDITLWGSRGTTTIEGPGSFSNCVTVGPTNSPCSATPTARSTWGRLKSLYR